MNSNVRIIVTILQDVLKTVNIFFNAEALEKLNFKNKLK